MRPQIKYFLALLLLVFSTVAIALFFSCASQPPATVYQKNGRTYGVVEGTFRHRWWNFYERGLSYAEGQYYEEAEADIKEALRQRDADQRMARSYGMHFLDYFPHRELGIVYFFQEKYDAAENELQTSLAMEESGKAKHYLNLVRKKKLELAGTDKTPPVIHLTQGADRQISNSIHFELTGEVQDDWFAREIAINKDPEFIELAAPKIPFSKTIRLKKGLNRINIQSIDLLGKTSEKTLEVVGDFEGPAINIQNYVDGDEVGENKIILNGALADATGIAALKIDEALLAYSKEKEIAFAFALELKEGQNKIMLAATDVAGNTTTGALNLTYRPQLAQSGKHHLAGTEQKDFPEEPVLLAFSGVSASDADRGLLHAAQGQGSRAAFRLDFRDLTDSQTVYYEPLYVDGSATGIHEIKSVRINGEPLYIIPGRTVYFNQLMALEEGENVITIEAIDAKGNSAAKTVTVIRIVQRVRRIGSRMSLAVFPFELTGDSSMAGRVIYDNLIGAFVEQQRFNIVTREELETILREQKLSQTDLVDKATAIKIGRLVAAEGIVMGTVRETRDSFEIYARLVNTETSTVMEAKDVFGQDKTLPQIQYLTNGLALKIKHSFPLVEGMVIRVKENEIYADFGAVENIKMEMKFIVFKQGEPIVHPVTGKVLGSDTEELGVARVVSVFDDMSIGKLIADFDASQIQIKDLVITK